MDRFQEMQAFVRIAERGSFSAAADDLNIPRPTITNLIKRLEMRLGARLLERTTRQVRLTHDGEAYHARCVRLLADLEEADGAFRNAMPKGLLSVNMQGTLARQLAPTLADHLNVQDLSAQRHQLAASRIKYVLLHHPSGGLFAWSPRRDGDLDSYRRTYSVAADGTGLTILRVY